MKKSDFIAYLRETLIPDLKESGHEATAIDFETCVQHMGPNLDCYSMDPKEVRDLAVVFDRLGRYCRCKADAMEARLTGRINDAQNMETFMVSIYNHLPEWAKW